MTQPFSSTKRNDPSKRGALQECFDVYMAGEHFFILVRALCEGVAGVLGLVFSGWVMFFEVLGAFVGGVLFIVDVIIAAIAAVFAAFSS